MKVSVIIPVYNQEKLVIRAIHSIPKRDDIEIIVIDDGSTDRTMEAVFWEQEHFDRLLLLTRGQNMGPGYSRNEGLDLATGEYVVMLDSDDYFYTGGFLECMKQLDGTDMVYYNLKINDGNVWRLTKDTRINLCGTTKFIRREFIGKTRYPDLRIGEDWNFNMALLAKNPTEKFTDITVLHYNFPREGSLYSKGKKV